MWKAFVRDDDYGRGKKLFMAESIGSSLHVLRPAALSIESIDAFGKAPEEPFLQENDTMFFQAMLDAFWDAGMRPSGLKPMMDMEKAQLRHLNDMRAIAFEKIGIKNPPA